MAALTGMYWITDKFYNFLVSTKLLLILCVRSYTVLNKKGKIINKIKFNIVFKVKNILITKGGQKINMEGSEHMKLANFSGNLFKIVNTIYM
jgi:hypothetical protein